MNKTLRISFSLRNTYRVNSILYSLKQLPLIKRLLPQALYSVRGLKIFANILSGIWEVISVFLGKFLYLIIMVVGIGSLYQGVPAGQVYLHILLLLTVIGSFMNTHMFNPTRDKYYAMILMRMNAREYTLVNYFYAILKVIAGFLPFTILFGLDAGVPFWLCVLLPFSIAGAKMAVAAYTLWEYENRKKVYNENRMQKYVWLCAGVLLAAAYGLPAAKVTIPQPAVGVLLILFAAAGAVGMRKILTFEKYRQINQEMLADMMNQMDTAAQVVQKQSQKSISTDTGITSNKKGFEYLNELFVKRHRKILWKSSRRLAVIALIMFAGMLLACGVSPAFRDTDE